MMTPSKTTHTPGNPPPHAFDDDTWQHAADALSDRALIEAVIAAITPPKATASSSFILHAPLELAARAALLPMVPVEARHMARRRIADIASRYVKSGDAAAAPAQQFASSADALTALAAAFEAKSADAADAAITHLAANASATELRHRLIDAIAPLLSAAGHAPILLAALPMLDQQFAGAKMLLRAPVRALAKASDVRLTWHVTPRAFPHIANAAEQLQKILAAPPRVVSESNSIAPTVLAVEKSGDAVRLLAPLVDSLTIADARRVLLRIAAWSMLQDDPKQAPYGWTHCLTLPQALLQNADASRNHSALIAIAATEVLGMRATEGNTDLDTTRPLSALPPAPSKEALAAFAASHHDAHVAKYTLACFQAAADDREGAPLFMAAAAYLHDWWRTHES
jgi:hypothetical protein